jgi:hypothetical protein
MKETALAAALWPVRQLHQLDPWYPPQDSPGFGSDSEVVPKVAGIVVEDPLQSPGRIPASSLPGYRQLIEELHHLRQSLADGLGPRSPKRIIGEQVPIVGKMGVAGGTGDKNRPFLPFERLDIFSSQPQGAFAVTGGKDGKTAAGEPRRRGQVIGIAGKQLTAGLGNLGEEVFGGTSWKIRDFFAPGRRFHPPAPPRNNRPSLWLKHRHTQAQTAVFRQTPGQTTGGLAHESCRSQEFGTVQGLAGKKFLEAMLPIESGKAGPRPDHLLGDIDPARAGLGAGAAEQAFGKDILKGRRRLLVFLECSQVVLAPGAIGLPAAAGLKDRADDRAGPAFRASDGVRTDDLSLLEKVKHYFCQSR